jgi:hypothetical protein
MGLNFNKKIYGLCLLVGVVSCQKNINFKIPDFPPMLVVNALFTSDSLMSVQVTSSVKALSNQSIPPVTNATVQVTVNNQTISLTHSSMGNYVNQSFKPSVGDVLMLNVSASNYSPVSAVTSIPALPIVDSLYYLASSGLNTSNYLGVIKVKDNPLLANYYLLCAYEYDSLGALNNLYLSFNSTTDFSEPTSDFFALNGCIFFNDEFLNGKIIEKTFKFYATPDIDSLGNVLGVTKKLFIGEVSAVSKEFYLYNWSVLRYQEANNNPFAEPVQVYSNVNNGIGIVGARSVYLKRLIPN